MIYITVLIWLIGSIISYLLFRWRLLKELNDEWTMADRKRSLFLSLFSWMMVLILLLEYILVPNKKDISKKVKW